MDDVLALQVVERQRHLTEVEFDGVLAELDALLQVVAQVSSQQEVHHHEHVLLILEGVPGTGGHSVLSGCVGREGWGGLGVWGGLARTHDTTRTQRTRSSMHTYLQCTCKSNHTAGQRQTSTGTCMYTDMQTHTCSVLFFGTAGTIF